MTKMMKRVLMCLLVVAVLVVVGHFYSCWSKIGLDELFDFDTNIDKTANVVEHIRTTAEFTTLCFYDEFVLMFSKENATSKSKINKFFQNTVNVGVPKDRMVLICKGKVRAGFDLKKVHDDDVAVSGDTLFLVVPEAEYFDVTLNPSDFEYFDRTGTWSHNQDTKVKQRAEERLREDADANDVLAKAEKIGLQRLEALYKSFGFAEVRVAVRRNAGDAVVRHH